MRLSGQFVYRHRYIFVLLAALGAPAVFAQPAPAPLASVAMSVEDVKVVYQELASTHDGFQHLYNVVRFASESEANATWLRLQEPRGRMVRFDKFFRNITPRASYLFALEPPLREKVVSLFEGDRTGPVQLRQGWVILEMLGTKAVPLPSLAEAEAFIPGLVATGTLPTVAELQSNPVLKNRTLLNAVRSVNDLKALPADVDVNARLSSQETLLLRSIGTQRLDLTEALLKRGANPNVCATKFCPLQLAIYRGLRAAVDLLLAAGADPNQRDAALRIEEGPLSAAALLGDVDVASKLVAAGARLNGYGTSSTPLMMASSKGNRAMAEFLIGKGADVFALTSTAPERTALDFAERSRNTEYATWLRSVMLKKAAESKTHAWEGWIEQGGVRQRLENRPIVLRRAPFRIITRMDPAAILYVAASTDKRLYEEFRPPAKNNLRFTGSISFEDNEGKSAFLVVYGPPGDPQGWGGSQAWWDEPGKGTRFTQTLRTAQGQEFVREVAEIKLMGKGVEMEDFKLSDFRQPALYLVLGTRARMTSMEDEVLLPRQVEIRFSD